MGEDAQNYQNEERYNPLRILIVDPHPVTCQGLQSLLTFNRQFELIDMINDGHALPARSQESQPHLLLLDPAIAGPPATEIITTIQARCPTTRVLVLTAQHDDQTVRQMLAAGVAGYLLKDEAPEVLLQALERVAQGGTWFSQAIMAKIMDWQQQLPEPTVSAQLTERDYQMLHMLSCGWSNVRIAAELHLAPQTVRNRLHQMYTKLGIHSRAEAIVWAQQQGANGRPNWWKK